MSSAPKIQAVPVASSPIKSPLVGQFKEHLERLGYSSGMVESMPRLLGEFLSMITKELSDIKRPDIQKYIEYLQERPNQKVSGGLSNAYIAHHLGALRVFFSWQMERGVLDASPLSGLEFKRTGSPARSVLSEAETKAMYEACKSLRELAILGLCYGCGLRRSEAVALQVGDVSYRTGLLYVRSGKGKKRRAVPMSKGVAKDLENYVVHERVAKPDNSSFLCNNQGRKVRGHWLAWQVRELKARAQIDKDITPHCLRHSIATHLLGRGLSLEEVRDFLGHSHIETTQRYTRVYKQQIWNLKNNSLKNTSTNDIAHRQPNAT